MRQRGVRKEERAGKWGHVRRSRCGVGKWTVGSEGGTVCVWCHRWGQPGSHWEVVEEAAVLGGGGCL